MAAREDASLYAAAVLPHRSHGAVMIAAVTGAPESVFLHGPLLASST
jgi:hypothetical protein